MVNKYNYKTEKEFIKQIKQSKLNIIDFIIKREIKLFGTSKSNIYTKLEEYLKTMETSVKFKEGYIRKTICLNNITEKINNKHNIQILNDLEYDILKSAISVSEYNCSMGKIIACPTAGSCGILPGVIIPIKNHFKISNKIIIESIIVSGEIGRLIGNKTSISGADGGCMVECGIGGAMAAAAIVYIFNGNNITGCFDAAAIVLKNNLGLTCDPVAGLVEVPCVKRNGLKALEALGAAQLVLCGIKSVIPFDEVVEVVKEVSKEIPKKYRETSEGGLATTPTGLNIKKKLI